MKVRDSQSFGTSQMGQIIGIIPGKKKWTFSSDISPERRKKRVTTQNFGVVRGVGCGGGDSVSENDRW